MRLGCTGGSRRTAFASRGARSPAPPVSISSALQPRTFYGDQLHTEEAVVAQGFITKRFVQGTRQQMEQAAQEDNLKISKSTVQRAEAAKG